MLPMTDRPEGLQEVRKLYRYVWLLVILWTVLLIAGVCWIHYHFYNSTLDIAANQARASIEKDLLYRKWMNYRGGLYSPLTPEIQPNEYYPHPERDLQTAEGDTLTKINTSYMSRMVYALSVDSGYVQGGHLSSSKPLHPGNSPDTWEAEGWKALEAGKHEYYGVVKSEQGKALRLMRPILLFESGCVSCHRAEGYELGDAKGAISVAVQLEPLFENAKPHRNSEWAVFGGFWLFGLLLLGLGARKIRTHIRATEDAQKALDSQRGFLQTIIDQSPVLLFIKDKTGRIVMCNRPFAAAYGKQPADMIGKHDSEIVDDPELIQKYATEDDFVQAEKQELVIPQGPYLPDDETARYVQTIKSPLFDEQGKVDRILCVSMEITERIRAEAALRRSELHFRLIFEATHDAIFVAQDNRMVVVNPRFEEMFGYSSDELYDPEFNYRSLMAGDEGARVAGYYWQIIRGEVESLDYVFTGYTKDQQRIRVDATIQRIVWDGEYAVLGVHRDITEKETLEAELRRQQKIDAIGALAGGIAHDFNNMITGIIAHAELVRMKYDPGPEIEQELQGILRTSDRAAELTRKLLAFSRKQYLHMEALDLNDVVNDMHDLLTRIVREDIVIARNLAEDLWTVSADRGQVEQVVLNLALNARDAMPNGGKLIITTTNREFSEQDAAHYTELEAGKYACVEVKDEGHGMSEEIIEHIFEPFFTTKEAGKGSGLGLATVYGIVKQSGGDIAVDSTPGKGTRFRIFFPRTRKKAPRRDMHAERARLKGDGQRILVVEDEKELRGHLVRSLTEMNYSVDSAENGLDALSVVAAAEEPYDLVLADVIMPGMGGVKMARELIKQNPDLKIVFMSGYAGDRLIPSRDDDLEFIYMQKPFHMLDLARRIHELLGGEKL